MVVQDRLGLQKQSVEFVVVRENSLFCLIDSFTCSFVISGCPVFQVLVFNLISGCPVFHCVSVLKNVKTSAQF